MFCTKCGKELEDNTSFCIYCGSKLDVSVKNSKSVNFDVDSSQINESEHDKANVSELSNTIPTQKNNRIRKFVPIIVVAVVAVVGVIVGSRLYNSPSAKMNRAIKAVDMELAYEIFDDNFYAEDLSEKSIGLLKTAATQVQENYLAGTTTYEEANETLRYIRQFGSSEVNETLSEVSSSIETQYQIAAKLESAEAYYQNGEYSSAITAYETVLSLDPSNADAASGITEAEDTWRNTVLEEAEHYASQGDLDSAADIIYMAAERYFGDDAELASELDSLYERRVEQMTDDVYTAADGGDWDGALELLDTYQAQYPDNQSLEDARADIVKKMPITLKNLTAVSSKETTVLTSVVSDRWGNVYDGAVNFDASNDAFSLYNLNKGYTSFTGTVFVPNEATNGKNMSFAIYLDEELVYYKDGITEETAPISFEIDVTGATTMRIVTDNTGSYPFGHLYFANTSFAKVEE